ncbi:putative F-box domain-containing protein [Medicago truncatula]|uniref:F-box protein interaction domain protein n=1 Tax=Medicago truncatula TaxID=3880 RepID=G7J0J7_MEDTR|nr:F-box/kelch-repeat protein At3g23880 [Medicago truncatula]AES68758.1 F-box protein interaction domain protein [Medicago truncatula]RHN65665.1 putative F-box domain-containing protein [Medicago truncatula]
MAYSGSDRNDKKLHLVCYSLHELLPFPTLPSDVIPEIICRLPVKFILRFRCVCKSWNSLISDPKFVKKQLCVSTTRNLHFRNYAYDSRKYILTSYPLDSDFTDITSNFTQSDWPYAKFYRFIGSCNGIVCLADNEYTSLVICWNPSTRKFKELPLFEKPTTGLNVMTFGFGYDSSKDNYKVVVVLDYQFLDEDYSFVNKTQVMVHTLGTNIWRTIQEYPFGGLPVPVKKGEFVSGTINWLFSEESLECPCFIVSFDLAKESYQKISPPNLGGVDVGDLSVLGVLRDCLCVTTSGYDVWLMKEYGNKESWTKLFTIPYMRDPSKPKVDARAIYVFEDDQVLLKYDFDLNLILYNPRRGTFKATNFKRIPEVCVESLISPSSLC